MLKRVSLLVFFILSVVFIVGCSNTDTGTEGQVVNDDKGVEDDEIRIGYVPGMTTDPFYISMRFGAEEKAEELGVDLIWSGAPEWDYKEQVVIIESMITEKVDAIIVTPTDEQALTAPLKRAMDEGIPVFTVDTNVMDESAYVANVTSDNVQGGALAADVLAELINESGKVLFLLTEPGVTTGIQRAEGFNEQMENEYPNIEIVGTEYTQDQVSISAEMTSNYLSSHPDLAGIFVASGVSTIGAAQALSNKNLENDIKIVSYDAGPAQIKLLEDNQIEAIVSQKPSEQASTVMQMAYDYLQGERDFENVILENLNVNIENIHDSEIQDAIYRED